MKKKYGIYTIGDANFFPGIVASVNSLKFHGYKGPIAIVDIGFEPWMKSYLDAYENVRVLDIEPVRNQIRFTDIRSNESPVMTGWAYKAFSILHYDLFRNWTFIDGDYFPLCNLEAELLGQIEEGHFISTEDGSNTWDRRHHDTMGVDPGTYMNINAGFISVNMDQHGYVVHEWRNLMTRRKPFELWHGDQGALNAILNKYDIRPALRDKTLWNQTWLNEKMARENKCRFVNKKDSVFVFYEPMNARIMGWHGTGWHRLWHQVGIDHYRKTKEERENFFKEGKGKSPEAMLNIFSHFLFMDKFNRKLKQSGHLLHE